MTIWDEFVCIRCRRVAAPRDGLCGSCVINLRLEFIEGFKQIVRYLTAAAPQGGLEH